MGKWGTHDVNLSQSNVQSMKEKGCRFCYISDNQKNIDKFNKSKDENTDKSKDENTDKSKDENTDNISFWLFSNRVPESNHASFFLMRLHAKVVCEFVFLIFCASSKITTSNGGTLFGFS